VKRANRARRSKLGAAAVAVSPGVIASGPTWVIGRASDLAFLIGGALVAFAMLGAHLVWGVPAVFLYMFWVLAIDGPHVFATFSRTYLDPEERAARTRLLAGSLLFFAVGPAAVGLSLVIGGAVYPTTRFSFSPRCGPTGTSCANTMA
jgi:hypothetical protein